MNVHRLQLLELHINQPVFQLGIFMRALRPVRTVCALPDYTFFFKFNFIFTKCNCCFCVFRQGCNNACKILANLCPCFHRSPTKLCPDLVSFVCWIATEFLSFTRKSDLVIRALNCARFCVVCALNCAGILVVRTLDCAQFLLHPALFPTYRWNTVNEHDDRPFCYYRHSLDH